VRWLWRLTLLLLLALLGVYAALPSLSGSAALRDWIAARLERQMAARVRFEALRINHDLSVTLTALSLADADAPPFLTVERIEVAVRPFSGVSRLLRIRIDEPHLYMARLPSQPEQRGVRPALSLDHAEIAEGFVHVPAADGTETVVGPLTLVVDSARDAPDQLRLAGGGRLPGAAGSVSWSAEIGATLADSRGSVNIDTVAPMEAIRPWIATAFPNEVRPTAATVRIDWRGEAEGHIALDLESTLQTPISAAPVRFAGSGTLDPEQRHARLELAANRLSLQSLDATRAASGVDLRAKLSARPDRGGARLDVEISVPAGEVLWDRLYLDLRGHPLELRGRLQTTATQLTLSDGTLSIGGIGTLSGTGAYDRERQRERWRMEFELPGLDAAYRVGVRDPLQEEFPVLGRVDLRGRATGTVEQQRLPSGARSFTGVVDLSGVSLRSSEPTVRIASLDAHLPIALSEDAGSAAAAQSGSIRARGLTLGEVVIGDVALPLRVETNLITLSEPIRIPMLGGALEIALLRATQLQTDEPQATLGVALHDLELEEMSRAFGWPRLTGVVVGSMPSLTVERRRIHSDGEIGIDVFGGSVRMRNLRVEEPLSPVPTVRFDLDIADISLAQLTSTLEIGKISGVAVGTVHELEIANRQPQRFDARLETVSRPGVPQRISVTAIRQLSILGGSGGDPFSFGVLGFFDEYRYAKMGFRCRLENDRFVLHGVEQIDGLDYLVVGSKIPPRVNVISHTPVIAFSELVRRVSRVFAVGSGSAASATQDDSAPDQDSDTTDEQTIPTTPPPP
jgi:hypothetical protein